MFPFSLSLCLYLSLCIVDELALALLDMFVCLLCLLVLDVTRWACKAGIVINKYASTDWRGSKPQPDVFCTNSYTLSNHFEKQSRPENQRDTSLFTNETPRPMAE